MALLSPSQKDMLQTVIEAAASGRYCHGNGANWVITNEDRSIVTCIDHVTGQISLMNAEESARYISSTRPHTDLSVVESLSHFIKTN